MSDFEDIRLELVKRRSQLSDRIQQLEQDIRHTQHPLEPDFAEQAVQRENEEVLDALDAAARTELQKINRALSRIENEKYGICTICGDDIPIERLKILPYSDYCIKCAEKAELPS